MGTSDGRGLPVKNAVVAVTLVLFLATVTLFVDVRELFSPACTETTAATATPSVRGGSEHQDDGAPSLESLLGESGSDKAMPGNGQGVHGYARYYERLLAPLRDVPVRFMEIGVERGRSLQVWQQYFSNADHVYGIGYGNFQKTPSQECASASATRVEVNVPCTIFKGDQSDVTFLRHFLKETGGNFHVILDDGSHVPSHQVTSFETLWPAVQPGGIYIVEDVETSWWNPTAKVYNYSLAGQASVVEKWKGVVDAVNREYNHGRSPLTDENAAIYGSISSVEFGQNVIIFHKALEDEGKLWGREYRFKDKQG